MSNKTIPLQSEYVGVCFFKHFHTKLIGRFIAANKVKINYPDII